MTTTISKVILFKKFIMSKKCQELASGLLWVNSERKDGGREEGDSVLGKPLLLNHFLYPPNYSLPSFVPKSPPPPRSGSFCISLPNCLFSSLKLLLPTPWPSWAPYCISYIIPLMERWRMYSQSKIIIIYSYQSLLFCLLCFSTGHFSQCQHVWMPKPMPLSKILHMCNWRRQPALALVFAF